MSRTTTAPRSGVTPEDIEAARRHRAELEERHESELEAAHAKLRAKRDASEDGVLPTDEATISEVEEVFAEADKTGLELDKARAHLARLQGKAYGTDPEDRMPAEEARRRGHAPGSIASARLVSLASRLIDSEAFQDAVEEAASRAGVKRTDVFRERLKSVPLADSEETALLLSVAGSRRGGVELAAQFDGDPLVPDDQSRVPVPIGQAVRQPVILDLITIGTTESDTVDYTVQTDEQGNVVGQPPGTAFNEATITVLLKTEEVRDRGILLPVPERNLEDNGRIRSFLDGRLRGMLRRDAEAQAVAGDGVGQNFTGIENWAGVGNYVAPAGEALADAIHKGITQVRTTLFDEPNAVAFTAEEWEELVLDKDADGRYKNSAGPLSAVPTSVWGKQGVMAHVLAADTSIVGKWDEAELIIRIGVMLREFEQHSDYAAKRLVLLRALYRAAFVVNQPAAFSVVDSSAIG